jgi:hypothetical protein
MDRTALQIRTVLVSYRASLRLARSSSDHAKMNRTRALAMLDDIAENEAAHISPYAARLLDEARREIIDAGMH